MRLRTRLIIVFTSQPSEKTVRVFSLSRARTPARLRTFERPACSSNHSCGKGAHARALRFPSHACTIADDGLRYRIKYRCSGALIEIAPAKVHSRAKTRQSICGAGPSVHSFGGSGNEDTLLWFSPCRFSSEKTSLSKAEQ
jgi:hypothetical protein